MTYVLLTRAKKNVGDFLIFDRAKKLIDKYKKKDFIVFKAWKPLDDHLKLINKCDAVIICGGPGVQSNFYPGIYPLTKNLEGISVPIILFGTGWYEFPGDDVTLKYFKFTPTSLRALQKISSESCFISCRDYLTKKILVKNGFTKILMTGCPSWYDLECINKPFNAPDEIKKIVFTPSQNAIYYGQSTKIMKMLKGMFRYEKLYCSFHRGWKSDGYTSKKEANRLAAIRSIAIKLGYEVVNAAYNLSNIEFYTECDLHIGYRLHGHIYFLSQRKPSFLLYEDGRGRGFSEAVGLLGIQAWESRLIGNSGREIMELLKTHTRANKLSVLVNVFQSLSIKPSKFAALEIRSYIENEIKSGFASFKGLAFVFRRHFDKMKRFLNSLP